MKKSLANIWQLSKNFLWSFGSAIIAVAITLFLLSQTVYLYQFHEFLANRIGPLELGVIVLLIVYFLYNIDVLSSSTKRAFNERQITIIDRLCLVVILWVFVLQVVLVVYTPWFSIDWSRLPELLLLSKALFGLALFWLLSRLSINLYRKYRRISSSQRLYLFSDEAAGTHTNNVDLIGRDNIVNQIVSVVKDFEVQEAFVIAITGEWGSGKTTVINFVLQKLINDDQVITVLFDPWYFSDGGEQSLNIVLKSFFHALESAVKPQVFRPDIPKIINRYYKAISPIIEKAPLKLDILFDNNTKDLHTLKNELEAIFSELNLKIVVVIDDLDRMDGVEIAYIFKLIRLCANFSNFIYIVAFDDQFVQERLEKEFGIRAKDYVDKIVQLELALPKVEPIVLSDIFTHSFAKLDKQQKLNLLQDGQFVDRLRTVFNPYVLFFLSNLRLIKRFLNRYFLLVPLLKNEVNYFDLFILELIRLKYPQIHETIYRNPQYFTYQNNSSCHL